MDWHNWGVSAAGDRVRSLVSGLPGDKSRLHGFMVLQAIIDDSKDGFQEKVFILGGYIATAEAWASLAVDWEAHLKELNITSYKFSRGDRVSDSWIDASFYRIIEHHNVPVWIDIIIDIKVLNEVVDQIHWERPNGEMTPLEKMFRNPYYLASKALMRNVFGHAKEMGFSEPIDFIFDEQTHEKVALIDAWEYFKKTMPDEIKSMMGAIPKFEDDEKFLPLQAADLAAGHIRQYEENVGSSLDQNPYPWGIYKEIKRYSTIVSKEALEKEFEWIVSKENFDQFMAHAQENAPWILESA